MSETPIDSLDKNNSSSMTYVSTQKTQFTPSQDIASADIKQGLLEVAGNNAGKISREELLKMITTIGDKFTTSDANLALSLIPKENGWIDIEQLTDLLFQTQIE
ncbi:hypothetical protein NEHOM01_2192 [Nematocida homosporus]|uniref:uncharacterized protein n=1 Tax=Nematocida homosporus TaxID=1912981 RepID=UPI002220996D|nr:uncharacterized protein NEHOM01_2192 [Nematocida homosporus]KAI5187456.1 hypothetical protein NEHOM01_2192 [Nematocida homosporus]